MFVLRIIKGVFAFRVHFVEQLQIFEKGLYDYITQFVWSMKYCWYVGRNIFLVKLNNPADTQSYFNVHLTFYGRHER